MRIAMWSGPRNLSTAMMYSFGARTDCAVVDEPFYAAYLANTGVEHPMRHEILASQPTDPQRVVAQILGPVPDGKAHFYQKHMTHHMVSGMPRDWMQYVTNLFLIRHPARVVASYSSKRENPSLADLGYVQQAELFDHAVALGQTPIVVDSADIREDPEGMLQRLCVGTGLDWDPAMLTWPAGGHRADGVWARHWYGAVHRSTGFDSSEGDLPKIEPEYMDLVEAALPHYKRLHAQRLR